MKRIVIIGGGGHAKVVIDAIKLSGTLKIAGIVDPGLAKGTKILDIEVLGDDSVLEGLRKEGIESAFIGVGSIGKEGVAIRKKIYEQLKGLGFELPVIKHPKAVVAGDVEIQEGTFIAGNAIINPGTKIRKNAIINTSSSIDHDCTIGDFVHIAPGAVLSGGVKVGNDTHIGTGAKIVQGIDVDENSFIKAGSLIHK